MFWITVILALSIAGGHAQKCRPLSFGKDSFVCVCNATYCDSSPDTGTPAEMTFHWYMSNKLNHRMEFTKGKMNNLKVNGSIISVDTTIKYQTILGFGAAFTDAAGINIKNLSLPAQENLIQSYFGEKESRYNIGRVPIGGTDFSKRSYSLDDFDMDKILQHFTLAQEDLLYKIPLLQRAAIVNPSLKLTGVPWSAPKWMKFKKSFGNFGVLNPDYYQLFSDYIMKFFDGYKKYGLGFWSLSIGNEPQNTISANTHKMTMAWTPYGTAKFVGKNLGPSLNASEYKNTEILILDDTLDSVSFYVPIVMNHEDAIKFISGTAIHYHQRTVMTESSRDKIHTSYPDKYILMTEASQFFSDEICLGCWDIMDAYILKMFKSMEHWVVGWMDLNLALNQKGEPNLLNNKYDAAIIVDAENDRFFKQPLFYVMQHFSRFVPPGSVRLNTRLNFQPFFDDLFVLAFDTPQEKTVFIIYNRGGVDIKVSITDGYEGYINADLTEFSLNTIIFKREK